MAITIQHTILDGNVGGTYDDAVAYAKFLEQQWLTDCANETETVNIDIRVERAEGCSPRTQIYGEMRGHLTDPQLVFERWLDSLNDATRDRVEGAVTSKTARINKHGLQQIADALGKYHKLGRDHFTPAMLSAWASDAEQSYSDGRGCQFEIRGLDTINGAPVIVSITEAGYDVEEAV